MKLKRFVVAVFVFLGACASMAEAQGGTAYGISNQPVTQEQLAVACEKGDPARLLNVTCEEIRLWLNAHRSGLNIRDTAALAVYIRSLNVIPCPVGKVELNREVGGKILHETEGHRWDRLFAIGEKCLYDGNRAEVQFSLSCANSPYGRLSVATAMVAPTPPPSSAPLVSPGPLQLAISAIPTINLNVHVDGEVKVVHTGRLEVVQGGQVTLLPATCPVGQVGKPPKCSIPVIGTKKRGIWRNKWTYIIGGGGVALGVVGKVVYDRYCWYW